MIPCYVLIPLWVIKGVSTYNMKENWTSQYSVPPQLFFCCIRIYDHIHLFQTTEILFIQISYTIINKTILIWVLRLKKLCDNQPLSPLNILRMFAWYLMVILILPIFPSGKNEQDTKNRFIPRDLTWVVSAKIYINGSR